MNPSDDPFALLPFAIAGIVLGVVLAGGCGYGLYQWRSADRGGDRWGNHVTFTGPIAWAGWRPSAAADGPDWYLQVRLEDEAHGFLVAASDVPGPLKDRYGFRVTARQARPISALMGKGARLAVDSSLVVDATNRTPYLSALQVAGETVVPFRKEAPAPAPLWWRVVLHGLLGLGALVGIGLFSASSQHVVVCLRHRSQTSFGR